MKRGGLSDDKKLKALTRSLETGWSSLRVGAHLGNTKATANNVANAILTDAKALAADGRAAEATTMIVAARQPAEGDLEEIWNMILDGIVTRL